MANLDLDHHLNDTVGCVFIGILLELILYGFSLAQTQYYFHEYPCDRLYIQILVAFLWLLDTARTCCDLQFLWDYLVTNHANLGGMSRFTNTFIAEFFLASCVVLIVQLYFIYSVWRFMAYKWHRFPLTITMVSLALLSFSGGVVSVYDFTVNSDLGASLDRAEVPASIQTVTAFVTDVYIAAALSIILHGKRTGFSGTDSLITKLVAFAIHRGIITALMQLLHFATYIGTLNDGPNKLFWALFHFPGSKIYTNSLLAVFNIRNWLRDGPAQAMVEEIELCSSGSGGSRSTGPPQIRAARIVVTTEVFSDTDLRNGRGRSGSGAGV
ncbi:uncharacterized protein C8Q71DRAFT_405159 [Rhodofomes roseus]|uniref:DUF6534 domain-containing protein n=1 Tax=Rhodofomes roseus TaxID=34475 RepID=A0ABQ8JYX9_9APHY|nr:uncharacterized protein C8Q71DRAFT_405159 [Rhodofomes roseus]KAH9829458.1 hypothetical protein C8Q71DRAFT_405159 [Rhodofomes roseus]